MAETSNDNRAARRRHAQQDLRRFVERFVDLIERRVALDGRCPYCRSAVRIFDHRSDCLGLEARAWLDQHPKSAREARFSPSPWQSPSRNDKEEPRA